MQDTVYGRLSSEQIWGYNKSPLYVTARWLPQQIPPICCQMVLVQGNFKGESVVAAILPLRVEVSYTARFFVAKPAK